MKNTGQRDRYGLGAFSIYISLSILFFGRSLIGHLTTRLIGKDVGDPGAHIWFLEWLPHALVGGHNPIFTAAIWAPAGINLSWTTWIPFEAILASPVTATLGPVASYNLLSLSSLTLAAWSAFLLCRQVSGTWAGSLVGGYIFAFSGYMISYLWVGDLCAISVFPIPLAVYTAVLALDAKISNRTLVVCLTALLIVQFTTFTEIFATATMFGLIAIVLAMALFPDDTRRRLSTLLFPILASYMLALVILSPYLYYIFSTVIPKSIWPVALYAADLTFFFLPSPASALGQVGVVRRYMATVPHSVFVGYNYCGPVVLAVVVHFALRHWREPGYRFLVIMFFVVATLSFGPRLTIGGRVLLPMPGLALYGLPLMRDALAARFTMYLGLISALIVALWLSTAEVSIYARCAVAALGVLFLLPSLSASYWDTPVDTPRFFTEGTYKRYLDPHEIVVIVPYGWIGNSMLWQAISKMYFRMAGGWSGMPPAEFQRWPAMVALFDGTYLPDAETQMKAFLAAHQVTAVLVDASAINSSSAKQRQNYRTVLNALGPPKNDIDGILVYKFTADELAHWRAFSATELERRVDEARFAALVDAVDRYVKSGAPPTSLSPTLLEKQNLIKSNWVGGPSILVGEGLWARGHDNETFDLGTFGSHDALSTINPHFRLNALQIRMLPIARSESQDSERNMELMIMTFDRAGLGRAALVARELSSSAPTPASDSSVAGSSNADH